MGKGWLCWVSLGLSLAAVAAVGLHILVWHGVHGRHCGAPVWGMRLGPHQHESGALTMRGWPHRSESHGGGIKVTPIVPRELRYYPGRKQWEVIPWRGDEVRAPFMRPGECPPATMMLLPNPTTYGK